MEQAKDISLRHYVKEFFGFEKFMGQQEAIIRNLIAGHDSFVLMPTGGGKSLTYQLPAMLMEGTAVIISPLIALMKNQVDAIRGFNEDDSVAHYLNSSLTKGQMQRVKADVTAGYTNMLYVAPESLTKEDNITFLRSIKIAFYAIDEAHCISEWGHDFRPEYRNIRPMVNKIGRAPIIALTATATPKVQNDIQKNLGILDAPVFKASFNRPNLYYEVRPKKDVTKNIIKFLRNNTGKSGIIYCLSRKKVTELAETLTVNGIKALPYHAGMDAATRSGTQDKFLMEEIDVIVATIAFGMGIDKPDVRFVIHHDMPKSLEGYYQETGRAGRDGGEGRCIAYYSYKDIQKLEKFMQGKPVAEQEIGKQLLMETVAYAESSVCRRKHLLHYFGETYNIKNCNTCDNCVHPKPQFEGKEAILKALKVVDTVKERFKADHVANILAGEEDSAIKSYKHNEIDVFGLGKEEDVKFWNAVLRQALIRKLLSKDIEQYGLLKITPKGRKYIKKPYSIQLIKEQDFDSMEGDDGSEQPGTSTVDPVLLKHLRDLRKKMSQKLGVPPYVIFQDPSLEDMAIHYPIDIEELKNIVGVGAGKANRYGEAFLEFIKKYVDENDIDRPQDMIVKSVAQKSGLKVYIVQSIDRKMPLDDIASNKKLEMSELLDEIEAIVNSGTRLNIDYYINEVMDEEHQEDIYAYFAESETGSLEAAIDELGQDEYTEEDIRLIRIKFISEVGN